MSKGRHVRAFDVEYVKALAEEYPDASAADLARLTVRSSATIARIMEGGYDELGKDMPTYVQPTLFEEQGDVFAVLHDIRKTLESVERKMGHGNQ